MHCTDSLQGTCLTYLAHDGGIQQHFPPAWLQDTSLQRCDDITHMEVDHVFQLVRSCI